MPQRSHSPKGYPPNGQSGTRSGSPMGSTGASTMLNTTLKMTQTSTSSSRARSQDKVVGEIRNIQVLGVIGTKVVVAYQGQGSVTAFVGNEHSLEMKEVGDGAGREKYHKYGGGKNFRYAEYEIPSLPTSIVVIGKTSGCDMINKPVREAHVRAQISPSGHVTKCHHQLLS